MIQVCQFDYILQWNIPLAALIFGIERLIAQQVFRNILLRIIMIFAEIANPKPHTITQQKYSKGHIVLLTFRTICPKVYTGVIVCLIIKKCIQSCIAL